MMAAAPVQPMEERGLIYPHGSVVPDMGGMLELWPGIFWVRMPLPFALNHINLWVLDGGDHWVIVDSGVAIAAIRDHWRALFAGPLAGKPVGRVIITHYHPDHIGLAGWLAHTWGVVPEMTRGEWLMARMLTLDNADHPPAESVDFYARHGWPEAAVSRMRASSGGRFAAGVHRLPIGYRRLRDGDCTQIGGREWRIVTGSGHSPEHACLLCEADGLLISGDQVLPRITSNISVYPGEPEADPLGEWLDSIARFRLLDAGLRVFPAHGQPFERLHVRLDQLEADHRAKLEALQAACATPLTAYESFSIMFRRPIGADEIQMATGEALAHLHWLERRGQVVAVMDGAWQRFARVG